MAWNTQTVQTGAQGMLGKVVIASTGRYYTAYLKLLAGTYTLCIGYSDDSGVTWTEVSTTGSGDIRNISIAIDSVDVVHVLYKLLYVVKYRTFANLTWGTAEDINDGSANTDDIYDGSMDIAVDSENIPHVCWVQDKTTETDKELWYSNRAAGSWAAPTALTNDTVDASYGEYNPRQARIYIDQDDYIWIFFDVVHAGGQFGIFYVHYVTSWGTPVKLESGYGSSVTLQPPSAVIDASGNVYVTWSIGSSPAALYYVKYTKSSDTFSSVTSIESISVTKPTLGIYGSTPFMVYGNSSTSLRTFNGSTWSSATVIFASNPLPFVSTPIYPVIGGVNTQRPTTDFIGTHFDSNILKVFRSSDLVLQTPQTENFSREENNALPTTDIVLDNLFTGSEYSQVDSDDNSYASQTATDNYAIFEFKNRGEYNTDAINVTWKGKSDLAPSSSIVKLQVYNHNTDTWGDVDTDNATAANTEFTLTGSLSGVGIENYYDPNLWVSFRVYQLAV